MAGDELMMGKPVSSSNCWSQFFIDKPVDASSLQQEFQ